MQPPRTTGAGGKETISTLPCLTCKRCHLSVTPKVYPSGPHLRADCSKCRQFIRFVPKHKLWLELSEALPAEVEPLFGGEQ